MDLQQCPASSPPQLTANQPCWTLQLRQQSAYTTSGCCEIFNEQDSTHVMHCTRSMDSLP